MADGEDHDLVPIIAVENDMAVAPELDRPFSELRLQFRHGPAELRMLAENAVALLVALNELLAIRQIFVCLTAE